MGTAGSAIRAWRKAAGLSLRDLARIAEVDKGYLSKVERGQREPSMQWMSIVMKAIADQANQGTAA